MYGSNCLFFYFVFYVFILFIFIFLLCLCFAVIQCEMKRKLPKKSKDVARKYEKEEPGWL